MPAVLPRVSSATLGLAGVLAVGLLARWTVVATQTYVVFADETFQYLEQAHRLAFGSGVIPWEYHDGIRSWLLPGVVAAVMRVVDAVLPGPGAYLGVVRGLCALLSLVVVWAGFTLGRARAGLAGAILVGGFCAVWFDLLYFAPTVMTEVLAAHLGLLGLVLADPARGASHRRWLWSGALLGLAVALRFQYAPALGLAALWLGWRDLRGLRLLVAAGAAVLLVVNGLLDWVSWGSPFQSIWLNILRNGRDGISAATGTDPAGFVLDYLRVALWPAPILLGLLAVGAARAPALAIAGLAAAVIHTIIPHKEVRYFYLLIAVAPVLIGLGAAAVLEVLAARGGGRAWRWGVPVLLGLFALVSWRDATSVALAGRWSFNRAPVQAFLAAHRAPDLCGLGVRDIRVIDSGGYVYLHRDVPLMYDGFDPSIALPGARVPLRFSVSQAGMDLPQPGPGGLAGMTGRFNYLVGQSAPQGYVAVECSGGFCLYRRPGGCEGGS